MAYFDSVDVAGTNCTAKFSAVAMLSSDAFLIPMVYDEVPMTTTKVSGDEWTGTTELGDFPIKLLTPSRAKLSGTVNYSDSAYPYVISFDVTLSKVASATLPPDEYRQRT